MSLRNQNWITFGGAPVTGRTPTQVRVSADTPGLVMNAQQEGFVAHAYKLFCDAINISAFPDGYHVQNRRAPDGTEVRMESNAGVHRVFVKLPTGKNEEPEYLLVASPRYVGDTLDFVHGDPAGEPYAFGIRKGQPITPRKKNLFKPLPGKTALSQQPGNVTWYDGRPADAENPAERRQFGDVLSWWGQPYGHAGPEPDELADRVNTSLGGRWVEPTRSLYLNGELLTSQFDDPVYGAALCRLVDPEDGEEKTYVRAVTFHRNFNNNNRRTLVQFRLVDALNYDNWSWRDIPANMKVVVGNAAFNSSGTRFVHLVSDFSTNPGGLDLVEIEAATLAQTVVCAGTETITGAPTITQTLIATGYVGYGAVDGDGIEFPEAMALDNHTQNMESAYNYAHDGEVTKVYVTPIGGDYEGEALRLYFLRRTAAMSVHESTVHACTETQVFERDARVDGYRTYDYYTKTVVGDVTTTGAISHTWTHEVVMQFAGDQAVVHTAGPFTPVAATYSGTKTRRFEGVKFSTGGTDGTPFVQDGSAEDYRAETYAAYPAPNLAAIRSIRTTVFACDPRLAYLAVVDLTTRMSAGNEEMQVAEYLGATKVGELAAPHFSTALGTARISMTEQTTWELGQWPAQTWPMTAYGEKTLAFSATGTGFNAIATTEAAPGATLEPPKMAVNSKLVLSETQAGVTSYGRGWAEPRGYNHIVYPKEPGTYRYNSADYVVRDAISPNIQLCQIKGEPKFLVVSGTAASMAVTASTPFSVPSGPPGTPRPDLYTPALFWQGADSRAQAFTAAASQPARGITLMHHYDLGAINIQTGGQAAQRHYDKPSARIALGLGSTPSGPSVRAWLSSPIFIPTWKPK